VFNYTESALNYLQTSSGIPSIKVIMQEHSQDIDELLSDAGDYLETKKSLWRLKAVDSISDLVSTLVSGLGIICILTIFILILSVAVALLIGDWLGKSFYGFFVIGGLYGIAGLVCYLFRERWLKEPIGNLLIRTLLKSGK
jgi:hypothetical protein